MTGVTIVIPTFRRPAELSRLLNSLALDLGARDDVAICVADNDRHASADAVVKAFAAAVPQSVSYRIAPEPGVSNARNAGMADVKSRYVLFLDDDMEVVVPYLDPFLMVAKRLGTTLTFSPAVAKLPPASESLAPWLAPLFSSVLPGPSRVVEQTLGTGGCLVDLQGLKLPSPMFDPALNEFGGEDDAFFGAVIAQGGTVGWCADVKAWEHVPPHRATTSYLWKRHFAFGQTPTREAADRGLGGLPAMAKWTLVGTAQALFHGSLFAIKSLFRDPSRITHMGRLAQGLGKILWWDGLSPRLYGSKAR